MELVVLLLVDLHRLLGTRYSLRSTVPVKWVDLATVFEGSIPHIGLDVNVSTRFAEAK